MTVMYRIAVLCCAKVDLRSRPRPGDTNLSKAQRSMRSLRCARFDALASMRSLRCARFDALASMRSLRSTRHGENVDKRRQRRREVTEESALDRVDRVDRDNVTRSQPDGVPD